jgi:carbon storage regulator
MTGTPIVVQHGNSALTANVTCTCSVDSNDFGRASRPLSLLRARTSSFRYYSEGLSGTVVGLFLFSLMDERQDVMLVLSRHKGESIVINDDITVTVVEIRGDKVRLGVTAPKEVPVHRQEVHEAIQRERMAQPLARTSFPSS